MVGEEGEEGQEDTKHLHFSKLQMMNHGFEKKNGLASSQQDLEEEDGETKKM